MTPFPQHLHRRWRRLDVPGHERVHIEQTLDGWRLTGHLRAHEGGMHMQLDYIIDCDYRWCTRSAVVTGASAGGPVRLAFTADGMGAWTLNRTPLPLVEGALDIDLGFTPATNLLPIRRLDLDVGQRANVLTAWLRSPELRVEPLGQSYHRESARVFRYNALIDGQPFRARLDTDEFGCVARYEGLWEAEPQPEGAGLQESQ
jgi:hypothetical protein